MKGNLHETPAEVRSLGLLLLLLVVARTGFDLIERAVPFFGVFDSFGTGRQWAWATSATFFLGAFLGLNARWFRVGCGLAGCALILKVLGSMPFFSNGRLFDGLMLLLIGLCGTRRGLGILRAQILVLYAGAALSKAIDPDWWNGRFMAAILEYHLSVNAFALIAPFAKVAGILSIGAESLIFALLATSRFRNPGVALTALFHTGILVTLNEDFATFYYAVAVSSALLFLRLPEVRAVGVPMPGLARLSVFSGVRAAMRTDASASVTFATGRLTGTRAWLFLMTSHLPFLAVAMGAAALCGHQGFLAARTGLAASLTFSALAAGVSVAAATWRPWTTHSGSAVRT